MLRRKLRNTHTQIRLFDDPRLFFGSCSSAVVLLLLFTNTSTSTSTSTNTNTSTSTRTSTSTSENSQRTTGSSNSRRTAESLCVCVLCVPTHLVSTPAVGKEARAAKAVEVEKQGIEFVRLFVRANKATKHPYLHILTTHLPRQIRDLPADPVCFQTSGLEHGHKQRKEVARGMCNFTGPKSAGETKTVAEYKKANGAVVREYKQGVGVGALHQLLRTELVANTLYKWESNSDGHLVKMERVKRAMHTNNAAQRYRLRQMVEATEPPKLKARKEKEALRRVL